MLYYPFFLSFFFFLFWWLQICLEVDSFVRTHARLGTQVL